MKTIGSYRQIIAYPDIYGRKDYFGQRIHPKLGLQILIKNFGDTAWINVRRHDLIPFGQIIT